jgi:hypothetical protein
VKRVLPREAPRHFVVAAILAEAVSSLFGYGERDGVSLYIVRGWPYAHPSSVPFAVNCEDLVESLEAIAESVDQGKIIPAARNDLKFIRQSIQRSGCDFGTCADNFAIRDLGNSKHSLIRKAIKKDFKSTGKLASGHTTDTSVTSARTTGGGWVVGVGTYRSSDPLRKVANTSIHTCFVDETAAVSKRNDAHLSTTRVNDRAS